MEGTMSESIQDRRKQTMLQRIGEAAELIDDLQYLPFYRSIQIKLEKMGKLEEWQKMIDAARSADAPGRYFAKLCKMVKAGTYNFTEKVKEISGAAAVLIHDKLVKFNFGKYQSYWFRKAQQFIDKNGMAGFIDLLEYADRKNVSQKYMAAALKNGRSPRLHYQQVIRGKA